MKVKHKETQEEFLNNAETTLRECKTFLKTAATFPRGLIRISTLCKKLNEYKGDASDLDKQTMRSIRITKSTLDKQNVFEIAEQKYKNNKELCDSLLRDVHECTEKMKHIPEPTPLVSEKTKQLYKKIEDHQKSVFNKLDEGRLLEKNVTKNLIAKWKKDLEQYPEITDTTILKGGDLSAFLNQCKVFRPKFESDSELYKTFQRQLNEIEILAGRASCVKEGCDVTGLKASFEDLYKLSGSTLKVCSECDDGLFCDSFEDLCSTHYYINSLLPRITAIQKRLDQVPSINNTDVDKRISDIQKICESIDIDKLIASDTLSELITYIKYLEQALPETKVLQAPFEDDSLSSSALDEEEEDSSSVSSLKRYRDVTCNTCEFRESALEYILNTHYSKIPTDIQDLLVMVRDNVDGDVFHPGKESQVFVFAVVANIINSGKAVIESTHLTWNEAMSAAKPNSQYVVRNILKIIKP